MINIIIADDQAILRDSLKQIIEQEPDLKVIACAENGKEALDLCYEMVPDVILMDIQMPECNGIDATKLVKKNFSSVKILMLTSFQDEEYISEALNLGADGYLLKDVKPDMLNLAIRSVYSGIPVVHKDALAVLTKNIHSSRELPDFEGTIRFTSRELEVIKLIVEGKTNPDIAKVVCLSKGRVANIITSILEKTGVKDRTELAVFAVRNNIIRP